MKGEFILRKIIEKGGLMACCAKMYIDDETLTRQFIIEISEQCHIEEFRGYLGQELISDISSFVLNSS